MPSCIWLGASNCVLSCWVLDIFCIPLRFFLSFLPGMKFSYLETFSWVFFQVLLLCSSRIFWSSALAAANYSLPLNQDLPEYTLYQCPRSWLSSPAVGNRHHSWFSLFLLTFSDGSLLRLMDALISTLPNTQGDPLLIFGVSVQLSVVWFCLLRNVADLVPGPNLFGHLSLFNSGHLPGFILVSPLWIVPWKICEEKQTGTMVGVTLLISSVLHCWWPVPLKLLFHIFCLFFCLSVWSGSVNPAPFLIHLDQK